ANSGVIAARNRGFAVSDPESDYVFFLDADDLLKPDMLARLVDYLDDRPEVSMVYCEPDWIDADGLPVKYGSPGTRYVPSRRGLADGGREADGERGLAAAPGPPSAAPVVGVGRRPPEPWGAGPGSRLLPAQLEAGGDLR